jgi:hypothetical protein
VLAKLPAALSSGDPDVDSAAGQVLKAYGVQTDDPPAHLADLAARLAALITVASVLDQRQAALFDLVEATPRPTTSPWRPTSTRPTARCCAQVRAERWLLGTRML